MFRLGSLITTSTLVATILVSVFSAPPAQAAQSTFNPTEIDALVNNIRGIYDVPGVAIGLIQNGKVVYTRGYGFADFENKRPVTDHTEFAIGSISKSFTALDIAQLVDAGKIDLDAPVIKYLPDFKLSDPDATKALTVRQVISHSSGLPRADERLGLTLDNRQQLVDDLANIPLTAEPGRSWQYSNQNYVLAGYLVEKITGQTWEAYTQTHIFDPLGMKATAPDMPSLLNAPDHALPYTIDVLKTVDLMKYTPDQMKVFKVIAPAGTITSNVVDMTQYALFQLGDRTFNGKQIVSKKLLDELHMRQIDARGMPEGNKKLVLSLTQDIGYGMGWFTETYQEHKLISHGGEIAGYTANVTLDPDDRVGIVILSNLNSTVPFVESLRLSLLANMLGLKSDDIPKQVAEHFQLDLTADKQNAAAARSFKADSAALKKFVGSYHGFTGLFLVEFVNGRLHLIIGSQNLELIPFADNNFLVNGLRGLTISFKVDKQGKTNLYLDSEPFGWLTDTKLAEFKDPKGRFTVLVPDELTLDKNGDVAVFHSTKYPNIYYIAVVESGSADIQSAVEEWLAKDLKITGAGLFSSLVESINGLTWSTYLYIVPEGRAVQITAVRVGNVIYLLCEDDQGKARLAFSDAFRELQFNFKITPS